MAVKLRARLALLVAVLLALGVGFAGCMGQEESGGDDGGTGDGNGGDGGAGDGGAGDGGAGDDGEDDAAWEEVFEVPEGATAVYLNLTIARAGEEGSQFEVRVLDPSGAVIVSHNGTWEDVLEAEEVSIGLGAATDANVTAEGELAPGKYTWQVWSDGAVFVEADLVIVAPEEAEAEA